MSSVGFCTGVRRHFLGANSSHDIREAVYEATSCRVSVLRDISFRTLQPHMGVFYNTLCIYVKSAIHWFGSVETFLGEKCSASCSRAKAIEKSVRYQIADVKRVSPEALVPNFSWIFFCEFEDFVPLKCSVINNSFSIKRNSWV